jgi:hypothetical protein
MAIKQSLEDSILTINNKSAKGPTFGLSDKELRRRQRLEDKSASDDDDSGDDDDDDDDNSSLRDKGKKKEGQKEVKQVSGRQKQDTCKHEGCARWAVRRGACITHGMTIYQDFGLLDKELLLRQLLENKAASDDDYSDDDDDDDDSSPQDKEKKAIGQKEEHQGRGRRREKKLASTRDAPNVCIGEEFVLQVRGMRQMGVSGRSLYRTWRDSEELQPGGVHQQRQTGRTLHEARREMQKKILSPRWVHQTGRSGRSLHDARRWG